MNMKNINHSPSSGELRNFGLIFGITTALLFGFLLPWLFEKNFPIWPWLVFVISGCLAILYPLSLNLIYKLWMLFGGIMAWINTRLILGFIYYFLFFPFSLMLKFVRKDPMSRKFDTKLSSYRMKNNDHDINHMENPF